MTFSPKPRWPRLQILDMKLRRFEGNSIVSPNGRNWIMLLAVALLAGGLNRVEAANQEPEPSYQGHSLYEWLCTYEAIDRSYPLRDRGFPFMMTALQEDLKSSTSAVRQIGSNAIPSLLAWIQYEDTWPRTNYLSRSNKVESALHRAQLAVVGFDLLGAEARAACPVLGRLASDPDKAGARERAMEALIKIGPEALPELVSILTNTIAPRREKAAEAIGGFGTNALAALPVLLRCTVDKDEKVVISAAVALSELPSRHDVVLPALTNVLNEPRLSVRWGGVRALSWHTPRPEVAVPALSHALSDPNPDVRCLAINVLSDLRPQRESVLLVLTSVMKDPNPSVRKRVIGALSGINPRPEAVQNLIANAMNDSHLEVRQAATNALKRASGELPPWFGP